MRKESKSRGRNHHYKVTTVRDGQIHEEIITRRQRACLDPSNVDAHIDEPAREVFIKPHSDRKGEACRPIHVRGLGVYVWDLLAEAVFSAGEVVSLKSTAWMNSRVRRLRRLFGDSKSRERFFKTRAMPYGIAINTERTWRYIEVLAE